MLPSRGFGEKFVSWVRIVLVHSSFCVRINDKNDLGFVGGKGLKQGDPLSPIILNFVADVFSKML